MLLTLGVCVRACSSRRTSYDDDFSTPARTLSALSIADFHGTNEFRRLHQLSK